MCDVRAFLPGPTKRLGRPSFPLAEAGKQYIRGFGLVRPRPRGGLENWTGEHVYCNSAKALKFDCRLSRYKIGETKISLSCAFRRFFSAGGCVSRVEVGVRVRDGGHLKLDSAECADIVKNFCEIPVRLSDRNGHAQVEPLLLMSSALSHYYLKCSTQRQLGQVFNAEAWWVTAGEPMILIEHNAEEVSSFPRFTRHVDVVQNESIDLYHCRIELLSQHLGIWFLRYSDQTNLDVLRQLQIHLARLHAERECLKQTLRLLAGGRITVVPRTEPSDNLQQFLDASVHLLSETSKCGINQQDILAVAQQFDALVTSGERAALVSELSKARRHICRVVERFALQQSEKQVSTPAPVNVIGTLVNYGRVEQTQGGPVTK